jgi:shikimate dehydrogenase
VTARFCVIGDPVEHSLSPAMHNAAFNALGIDAVYDKRLVEPAQLVDAVAELRALQIAGFNVTVPHKETIMALLDHVEPAARAIGAVNTVVREGDRLIGCNTDAEGLAASLREARVELKSAHVVIVGAGGAARAAVVGLGRAGASTIVIAARRADRAEALARELREAAGVPAVGVDMRKGLRASLATATLLVQATTATLNNNAGADAFADSIPLGMMPLHATVIDLVYRPLRTTLLERASKNGLRTVDGLGMLLHQGAVAFSRWTGQPAPLDVMRQALIAAIGEPSIRS